MVRVALITLVVSSTAPTPTPFNEVLVLSDIFSTYSSEWVASKKTMKYLSLQRRIMFTERLHCMILCTRYRLLCMKVKPGNEEDVTVWDGMQNILCKIWSNEASTCCCHSNLWLLARYRGWYSLLTRVSQVTPGTVDLDWPVAQSRTHTLEDILSWRL